MCVYKVLVVCVCVWGGGGGGGERVVECRRRDGEEEGRLDLCGGEWDTQTENGMCSISM